MFRLGGLGRSLGVAASGALLVLTSSCGGVATTSSDYSGSSGSYAGSSAVDPALPPVADSPSPSDSAHAADPNQEGPVAMTEVTFEIETVSGIASGPTGYFITGADGLLVATAALGEVAEDERIVFKVPLQTGVGYRAVVSTSPIDSAISCRVEFGPFNVQEGVPLTLGKPLTCRENGPGQILVDPDPKAPKCHNDKVHGLELDPIAAPADGAIALRAPALPEDAPGNYSWTVSAPSDIWVPPVGHEATTVLRCNGVGELSVQVTMHTGFCSYVRGATAFCLPNSF